MKTMLINLNTFALNAKVIILNEKDINNSINLLNFFEELTTYFLKSILL